MTYTVALYSPGRDYAGLTGRNLSRAQATQTIADTLGGAHHYTTPQDIVRAGFLVTHAPSSVTLENSHRLTVDPEPTTERNAA